MERWSTVLAVLVGSVFTLGYGGAQSDPSNTTVELTTTEEATIEETPLPGIVRMRGGSAVMKVGRLSAERAKPAAEESDDAGKDQDGKQPASQAGGHPVAPAVVGKDSAKPAEGGKDISKPGETSSGLGNGYAPVGGNAPIKPGQAADCPLKQAGNHPWLIRITPMTSLPNPPSQRKIGKGGLGKGSIDRLLEGDDIVRNSLPRRFGSIGRKARQPERRQAEPIDDDLDEEEDYSADYSPISPAIMGNMEGKRTPPKADGSSIMHGSLITPNKVLTTAAYERYWSTNLPLPEKYLSLIGYNQELNCKQEQWGKDISFHASSSKFTINVGEFALIETSDPFIVEGEPFLFGNPSQPADLKATVSFRREAIVLRASSQYLISKTC